jgi:hypothetical protein
MLTVYKGIPVLFFDFLVYPDGRFRLVDKKSRLKVENLKYFPRRKPDILLLGNGTGPESRADADTFFRFNEFTERCMQVIVLPTPSACRKFNELKAQRKSVMLVIHHSIGA